MKTSSSVGRETLTERIGTPSSPNRRGTNSSPDSTKTVAAVPQVDHLEHLLHARFDQAGLVAVELGVQPEVLLGGEVAVERGVLEDEADVAPDVVALLGHVVARDTGMAARGAHERAQH